MFTRPLLLSVLAPAAAWALTVPFTKRGVVTSTSYEFENVQDEIYVGTIHVGGQPFEVQIDTGSSDLWLDTANATVDKFADTGVHAKVTYGDHTVAQGPILVGPVSFGDFTVEKQAFISAPGSNATTAPDRGLLGIGPNSLSEINDKLKGNEHSGNSFLENVFQQTGSKDNYLSFTLTRSDVGTTSGGTFTINEIVSQYSTIHDQAKLTVDPSTMQWITPLKSVTINGHDINGHSGVPNMIDGGSTAALLDSGTTFAVAPKVYVDAIYKDLPGAQLMKNSMYIVPCDVPVNVTFHFPGGVSVPVNPLDMVALDVDDKNNVVCIGTFMIGDMTDQGLDWILGDSFLRNSYTLYNFGSFVKGVNDAPYIQLISTTDISAAQKDFASATQTRLQQFAQANNATIPPPTSPNTPTTTSTPSTSSSSAPVTTGNPDFRNDWDFRL